MKKVILFFTGIISFLVCIVLFAVQMGLFGLINVKYFVTADAIRDSINSLDVKEIFTADDNEIYEATDKLGISQDTVNEALNSKYIKDIISKVVVNTYIEITTGEVQEKVTKNELLTAIENSINLVNEKEVNITADQEKIIVDFLGKNYDKVISEFSLSDKILEGFDTNTAKIVHFGFSTLAIVAIVFVMLVLTFIIALLRWSVYKWSIWTGVTTLLSSIIVFTSGFFIQIVTSYIPIEKSFESAMIIVNTFVVNLKLNLIISGAIGLVLGILQVVLFSLVSKKKKKKININSLEKELEM